MCSVEKSSLITQQKAFVEKAEKRIGSRYCRIIALKLKVLIIQIKGPDIFRENKCL